MNPADIETERKRCDEIIGLLWVDLVNTDFNARVAADAFSYRREQIRNGIDLNEIG